MSRYTPIDSGVTSRGEPWQVGLIGDRLIVMQGRLTISIEGGEREKFTEAVARAGMPGRAERRAEAHGQVSGRG